MLQSALVLWRSLGIISFTLSQWQLYAWLWFTLWAESSFAWRRVICRIPKYLKIDKNCSALEVHFETSWRSNKTATIIQTTKWKKKELRQKHALRHDRHVIICMHVYIYKEEEEESTAVQSRKMMASGRTDWTT